jgi:superfamily I DNA/RNA helicase
MLSEDIEEPRGAACITYNNECARELETRLDGLGVEAGRRVFIGTVHSFSLTQIVMPYAKSASLGLPDGFRVATQYEQRGALEQAFGKTIGGPENPQNWSFRMGRYRRSILNRESREWRTSDPELARLVEAYEAELRAGGLIDFDDMPLLAVRALRQHTWLQRAILAKFPVLVVDEYQDLGRALHRMVMGLCFSTGIRLFAVGDVDQSIYGFTGAHPELLEQISAREDVQTVRLQFNYRCGSRIVAASRNMRSAKCEDTKPRRARTKERSIFTRSKGTTLSMLSIYFRPCFPMCLRESRASPLRTSPSCIQPHGLATPSRNPHRITDLESYGPTQMLFIPAQVGSCVGLSSVRFGAAADGGPARRAF